MTSESIYAILASKPHNEHYLARYFNFIMQCKHDENEYMEELELITQPRSEKQRQQAS